MADEVESLGANAVSRRQEIILEGVLSQVGRMAPIAPRQSLQWSVVTKGKRIVPLDGGLTGRSERAGTLIL